MKYFIILLLVTILSCAGKDITDSDTTPPNAPQLIPHLGDSFISAHDSTNFYNGLDLDIENNGIDAFGDGIQLQWHHLPEPDIDYLKIYRFSSEDYNQDLELIEYSTCLDTLDYYNQMLYLDQNPLLQTNWFYFMTAIDNSGNESDFSNLVCYKLLSQPLIFPTDSLFFEWDPEGYASFRIMLFDENHELIWSDDPIDVSAAALPIEYDGPEIQTPTTLSWRVDVFGNSFTPLPINGIIYTVESGAESDEGQINLQ